MSAKTATAQLIIKQPQYVEESTEGTTPTASPSFNEIGKISSLSFNIDNSSTDVMQIGPEDLYNIVQGKTVNSFTIKTTMFASTFAKYALSAANYGTPAGTISAPISIVFSFYLNGVENYVFLKGCRAVNATLSGEIGQAIQLSVEFKCISITEPATSSGLTTPTYITPSSTAVWTWLTGGAAPVTWNASGVNAVKVEVTVNRNTVEDYTLGNTAPYTIQPHGRRIGGSVTVLWTDTTMSGDRNAFTSRTMTWILKTATSTATLTGAVLDKQSTDISAEQSSSLVHVFNFKATALSIT